MTRTDDNDEDAVAHIGQDTIDGHIVNVCDGADWWATLGGGTRCPDCAATLQRQMKERL